MPKEEDVSLIICLCPHSMWPQLKMELNAYELSLRATQTSLAHA